MNFYLKKILIQNGCFDNVGIAVSKEMYPEKRYGTFTFPSGEYLSVRVLIGEGKGENWWCVLFPPLCNAGIEEGAKVLESHGLSKQEIEALESHNERFSFELFGCKIKFRILDFIN